MTNLYFFGHHQEIKQRSKTSAFSDVIAKCHKCKIKKKDGHGKSRNGHEKVMEKSWKNILSSLILPVILKDLLQ